MVGEKQSVSVVVINSDLALNLGSLEGTPLETYLHATLDAWASSSSRGDDLSGQPSVGEDCLLVVARLADIRHHSVISRVAAACPGLPLVIAAPNATLADASDVVHQGAFALVELEGDPSQIVSALSHAANEGKRTAARRTHLSALKQRFEQLTPAERQVLDAMLEGMANKQIAQVLEIGLRTVELRRSKIMRKMNARNLAELVKFICLAQPQIVSEPPVNTESQQLTPVH